LTSDVVANKETGHDSSLLAFQWTILGVREEIKNKIHDRSCEEGVLKRTRMFTKYLGGLDGRFWYSQSCSWHKKRKRELDLNGCRSLCISLAKVIT